MFNPLKTHKVKHMILYPDLWTWKKTKFLGRISRFLLLYTSGVPFGVVVYSHTNYTPILLCPRNLELWDSAQRRVYSFFFINLENPISVLYSTKFHPQRNTFLPFPRPLWGTLAHPERTGAALDSSKANAPPWYFSAARLRGPSGETTAHRDLLRGCWPKSVQQTTWDCENHASRVRVRSVSVQ